jgi:uncharacterized membrane protein (DUF4010 family)
MQPELSEIAAIAAAGLGGAAVGIEREWSGHASGPRARFGGIRTFTLLGGTAGMAGYMWKDAPTLAALLLAAAGALVVAAYIAASRSDVEATTEVAALVVTAAGVLDGLGHVALASGVIAVTWLLLVEKPGLHGFVRRIDETEMRAAARFAVMAVVVLPLLPEGPYGPLGGIRPRELWMLVLLFSGLSFAGWVARRTVGAERGDVLAGLLGGLVSSTAVTLTFARASRGAPSLAPSLALGVVGANTVMFARLLVASAVLNQTLARATAPVLLVPFALGLAIVYLASRRVRPHRARTDTPASPLQLTTALKMAAVFQVVLFLVEAVQRAYGDLGLLATSALVGLTDTDALTLSIARSTGAGTPAAVGVRAIAIGAISNTVFKLVAALTLGESRFRRWVALGLVALGAATGLMLLVVPAD